MWYGQAVARAWDRSGYSGWMGSSLWLREGWVACSDRGRDGWHAVLMGVGRGAGGNMVGDDLRIRGDYHSTLGVMSGPG